MKALFQNPKAALLYVGITVAGVMLFVGTEENPGSLHQTVENFGDGMTAQDRAAQRKFGDPAPTPASANSGKSKPKKKEAPVVFATDADLIDDAGGFSADGFDPTPEVFDGFSARGEEEEPYLADQDKDDEEASFGGWGAGTDGAESDEDRKRNRRNRRDRRDDEEDDNNGFG